MKRTPRFCFKALNGRMSHRKLFAGFSQDHHPPNFCCVRASFANRVASMFASTTHIGLGRKPSGTSELLKIFAVPYLSDRRARENVRHGGAPCSQRTLPSRTCAIKHEVQNGLPTRNPEVPEQVDRIATLLQLARPGRRTAQGTKSCPSTSPAIVFAQKPVGNDVHLALLLAVELLEDA
eukprot:13063895-Heterocapsa_arctica.AAC.1